MGTSPATVRDVGGARGVGQATAGVVDRGPADILAIDGQDRGVELDSRRAGCALDDRADHEAIVPGR